jgi:hypothetical protein
MNLTHMMRIALIVLGVSIALGQRAGAQTTPGLLVTQPELDIWKQRAISGPYKSKGDVSTNSPGDWDTIIANANNLVPGLSGNDYWRGADCVVIHCPARIGDPDPPRTMWNMTRDAAFAWLITGNTTYLTKAKTQYLSELAEPGLNFGDTGRWNNTLNDSNPAFGTLQLLSRLFLGYTYIRSQFTPSEQASLDAWFLKMGVYWEDTQQQRFGGTGWFSDRESLTNFNLTASGQSAASSIAANAGMWCGGNSETNMSGIWNNRTADFPMFYSLIGAYYDQVAPSATTTHLVKKSKRWVMEWMLYAVWPNGVITEWGRSAQQGHGYIGWAYSQQNLAEVLIVADALARKGDSELYEMVTTATGISTEAGSTGYSGALSWGAGKSLKFIAQQQTKYTTDEQRRASINCSNPSYPTDYQRDEVTGVRDTFVAQSNQYWRDTCTAPTACLQTRYLRTAPNAIPYPASPTSGGTNPWGGTGGILPGVLFMYGQMEGKVQPYPGSDELLAPTNLRITNTP